MTKARNEFSKMVIDYNKEEGEKDIALMNAKDLLRKYLTVDSQTELAFVHCISCEAQRLFPASPVSSEYSLSQDAKVGEYHLKAGEKIFLNFNSLHTNSKEW